MGKGNNVHSTPEVVVKLLKEPLQNIDNKMGTPGWNRNSIIIPPGIPECDIVLKGTTRFWYLESVLFIFGIVGVIVSAVMLIWHYLNSSTYL